MSIGTRLKSLRKIYGYSQKDVAQLMRITPETLAKWEQEKGLPNGVSLVNFSKLYAINHNTLLQEQDNKSGNLFQKTIDVVNRKFTQRLSKEQSPPLTVEDLSHVLNKKGLILARSLAEKDQAQAQLDQLAFQLTERYKHNVNWQIVNALEARKIVATDPVDFVIFTPLTAIFIEQIKKAALNQPALVRLSPGLHKNLIT